MVVHVIGGGFNDDTGGKEPKGIQGSEEGIETTANRTGARSLGRDIRWEQWITCTTTTDLWGINFHWDGEQSAYDAVEGQANALGFTLGTIFNELERRAVKRYSQEVQAKHDLEALKKRVNKLMDDVEVKVEVIDGKRCVNCYSSDETWAALEAVAALKGTTMDGMIKDFFASQLKQSKGEVDGA